MCGITGAFNSERAFEIVSTGLNIIKERGIDGSGIFDSKKVQHSEKINEIKGSDSRNIVGHVLHSIVNTVPQPIKENDSILVANCEIYNWKELDLEYKLNSENDSVLLLRLIDKLGIEEALKKLRGVYAFCYWKNNDIYLARDIIGIKPLWFSQESGLTFCSEKKTIEKYGITQELNPRSILHYKIKENKINFIRRDFFTIKESEDNEKQVLEKLEKKLKEAVKIRIPDRKFALLLSGGLDSVLIAKLLKDSGKEFTCYITATSEDKEDVVVAKKIAKELDLNLKVIILSEKEVEKVIKKVTPLIEDSNVVKVGVAATLYAACEAAKNDKNKVIFSGSGADELFAGYNRYKNQDLKDINKDCYSDILKFYERNSYRDDVITMHNNLELRVPFLDKKLVEFSLNISPSLKIKKVGLIEKYILRKLAEKLDLPRYISTRKKKAAQYGSGVDRAIGKLAKKHNFPSKSAYLDSLLPKKIMKLGALISSGKDSWFAAYLMHQQNYEIPCLITLESDNPSSYMFHTPNVSLAEMQSKASDIPIIKQKTSGEKEKELEDLKTALKKAKKEHKIQGIVSGALFSNYQRERIERVADELHLKIFSPLWHMDQEQEMHALLNKDFEIMFSSVAAEGLDKSWLGRIITHEDVDSLVKLNEKAGLNIAGEGGEFESLVLYCPLFNKKIDILEKEIIEEEKNIAKMVVKKAKLQEN